MYCFLKAQQQDNDILRHGEIIVTERGSVVCDIPICRRMMGSPRRAQNECTGGDLQDPAETQAEQACQGCGVLGCRMRPTSMGVRISEFAVWP
jgi:hypothetical protein